ncbi:hypothetical protein LEP1GSC043_1551 [Leptospira weilii str. Ecochallenge]|uniref:Uncharacterized protein n=1 Tax=Leptospira weilii str. Ecochallenge TaxID=1049986 RepID=N1UAT1_9LEPT|nr:hypothetical protein LEP1GSC043_1551 [Leptospira weilii str. Ecochallenge]
MTRSVASLNEPVGFGFNQVERENSLNFDVRTDSKKEFLSQPLNFLYLIIQKRPYRV